MAEVPIRFTPLVLLDSSHSYMFLDVNLAHHLRYVLPRTCALFWWWIKWWMVFILRLICLITVDITGYCCSPPTFLHSSDTKYGVGRSAHRLEGKRHIPQSEQEKLHNSIGTFFFFLGNSLYHNIRNRLLPVYCINHLPGKLDLILFVSCI